MSSKHFEVGNRLAIGPRRTLHPHRCQGSPAPRATPTSSANPSTAAWVTSWRLATYVHAVLDAPEAVEEICATDKSVLFSLCAGGIISSMTLGHLVATGQEHRLAGFALGVTLHDQSHAGLMASATSPELVAAAAAKPRATDEVGVVSASE